MVKKCIICGNQFNANYERRICCSRECAKERQRRKAAQYYCDNQQRLIEKARKPKKKKPVVPSMPWIEQYVNTDEMGRVKMLADENNMSYGQMSALKQCNPDKFEKLREKAERKYEYLGKAKRS